MNINNRFKEIINTCYKGNKRAFSTAVGLSTSVIENVVGKRNGNPSYEVLEKVCANANINPEWLLTGKGNMLKENGNDSNKITKIHKPKYMEKTFDEQIIPLYNIEAAANLKTLFINKEQFMIGSIKIPNSPKCDGAIYVRGESMTPLLRPGDIICYKEYYNWENIIYGEIYLASIDLGGDEYLAVKYIRKSNRGDDWISMESENKQHDPKDFPIKSINALAMVKISIRLNVMG